MVWHAFGLVKAASPRSILALDTLHFSNASIVEYSIFIGIIEPPTLHSSFSDSSIVENYYSTTSSSSSENSNFVLCTLHTLDSSIVENLFSISTPEIHSFAIVHTWNSSIATLKSRTSHSSTFEQQHSRVYHQHNPTSYFALFSLWTAA